VRAVDDTHAPLQMLADGHPTELDISYANDSENDICNSDTNWGPQGTPRGRGGSIALL